MATTSASDCLYYNYPDKCRSQQDLRREKSMVGTEKLTTGMRSSRTEKYGPKGNAPVQLYAGVNVGKRVKITDKGY